MRSREGLVAGTSHHDLVPQPLEVREEDAAVRRNASTLDPRGPEVQSLRRPDAPDDPMDHPRAGPPGPRTGILEERELRARPAQLVGVEEVVDRRVVLVDGLRRHAQPQHMRVEVDVPGRVARDRGDVVDSLDLHDLSLQVVARTTISAKSERSPPCP